MCNEVVNPSCLHASGSAPLPHSVAATTEAMKMCSFRKTPDLFLFWEDDFCGNAPHPSKSPTISFPNKCI